jgi:predicted nucleic acid-binding protein
VDSSGWLEYYTGGANAAFFRPVIETDETLIVPTIVIYEVFRHVLRNVGEEEALVAVGAMQERNVIELSAMIARLAAKLAHEHKLAMADSIILATARQFDATIWTQDVDFEGLEKVKFRAKPK